MTDQDRDPELQGTLSFLFTDIEHSSALWEHDPLAMRRALQLHDAIVREATDRHAGTVFYSGGDGFGAAFDAPISAVGAAREAQVGLARAPWPATVPLRVRMGIHTGPAEHRDGNYFGAAVNRAARVADAGHGGQVLVSEDTAMAVAHEVDLVDLGSFQLRGLRHPERIWWLPVPEVHGDGFPALRSARVGEVKPLPLPPRLRFDGDVRFVGRNRPLEQLLGALPVAREGGSPVVAVSGEPGVGKTRLVSEAAGRFHDQGATVLYGRCDPHRGTPYQPFAEALATAADSLDLDNVRTVLAPHTGDLARLVPRLRQIVPGLAEPIEGDGTGDRARLFGAVRDALSALADLTPGVVLVVDDFHWADESTVALLEHLVVSAPPPGVMIMITYRQTDLDRGEPKEELLGLVRRRAGAVTVPLSGLTLPEVEDYVAAVAGHELGDLEPAVARLHSSTAGNPFFISELIRHFVDMRAVTWTGSRWKFRPLSETGLPAGIRELVRERLGNLPDATVELLQMAAVFGEEFELPFVAHAAGSDVPTALAALEPALTANLVVASGAGGARFQHALVRTTIYDDLPADRRVAAHVAAARAIDAVPGGDRYWPDLARHWAEAAPAGHGDEALRSAVNAGEQAIAAAAHDEAARYLSAALARFGDRTTSAGFERTGVQLMLAETLNMAGRLEEAHRQFVEVADEARRAGRPDVYASAALGLGGDLPLTPPADPVAIAMIEQALAMHPDPSPTRARLLGRLAERRHRIDDLATRTALVDEAVELARAFDDDDLLARVLLSRARTLSGPGSMRELLELSDEVDRIAARLADDAMAIRSSQVRMVGCFVLGDFLGAAQASRVTAVLAARLRQPEFERLPLMWEAFRAMLEGRFDAGARLVDEINELLGHGRHTQTRAMVGALRTPPLVFRGQTELAYAVVRDLDIPYREALLAWFSAESGALDRARHHLDRLGPIACIEADQNWSWWQAIAGTATAASRCAVMPILEELRRVITPYADQHATAGMVTYLGSGHHHLGVVEGALGNLHAAVHELEAAVIAEETLGARPYVASSQIELARVLDTRKGPGDAAQAALLRATALDTAGILGLDSVLARA